MDDISCLWSGFGLRAGGVGLWRELECAGSMCERGGGGRMRLCDASLVAARRTLYLPHRQVKSIRRPDGMMVGMLDSVAVVARWREVSIGVN